MHPFLIVEAQGKHLAIVVADHEDEALVTFLKHNRQYKVNDVKVKAFPVYYAHPIESDD